MEFPVDQDFADAVIDAQVAAADAVSGRRQHDPVGRLRGAGIRRWPAAVVGRHATLAAAVHQRMHGHQVCPPITERIHVRSNSAPSTGDRAATDCAGVYSSPLPKCLRH